MLDKYSQKLPSPSESPAEPFQLGDLNVVPNANKLLEPSNANTSSKDALRNLNEAIKNGAFNNARNNENP